MPQELSQEEFFQGISPPRNKELMRIFKDVTLVKQLGSGIKRFLRSYDKEIFSFFPYFLKLSFPIIEAGKDAGESAGKKIGLLTETQSLIIDLIQENPYISQKEWSRTLEG